MARGEELTIVPQAFHNGGVRERPFAEATAYAIPPGAAGDYPTFNMLLTQIAAATRYDRMMDLRNEVRQATTLTEREAEVLVRLLAVKWVALGEVNHTAEDTISGYLRTLPYTASQIQNMPVSFNRSDVGAVTETAVFLKSGKEIYLMQLNPHEMEMVRDLLRRRG